MSFTKLGLREELLKAISDQGYETPTPVQKQAIPVVLQKKDILAGAQTGTGKTAGFTLPILQLLSMNPPTDRRYVRALILTPTRELAAQVYESVKTYGKYLPAIHSTVVFGGVNINPQIKHLGRGVDIVVGTPGRLLDHHKQGNVNLSRVEILVLDEADRMLDMGFINDIRKIIAILPKQRQTLFFSATFSDEITKLSKTILTSPVAIEVTRHNTTAETVKQTIYYVNQARKRELLSFMIGTNNWKQVLVFTRTKHGANKLAEQLSKDGLNTAAIHGNKSQGARTKALADFKAGKVRVLVATDIAARGLDIDQLPHVINFELPNIPEDYVHRIGRTGRAGNEGEAISLVCADERVYLKDIEKLLNRELEKKTLPGYEPSESFSGPIKAKPKMGGSGGSRPQQNRFGKSSSDQGRSRDDRKGSSSSSGNKTSWGGDKDSRSSRPPAKKGRSGYNR